MALLAENRRVKLEKLLKMAVRLGRANGHRAVEINRDVCLEPLKEEMNLVQKLLGALDRERRNEQDAAIFDRLFNGRAQLCRALLGRFVQPVAVGRFAHDRIRPRNRLGLWQDGNIVIPDVAGKDDALPFSLDRNVGGSQNVPGVVEHNRNPLGEFNRLVVVDRAHVRERGLQILFRIQKRRAALLGLLLHDLERVLQNQSRERKRRLCHVKRSGIALLDELRQAACVVCMRVRHEHGVERLRVESKRLSIFPGRGLLALKQAAIN